jgi:hypothetical protein
MTKLHEWRGRLYSGDEYPIENGPPYLSASGAPIVPGAQEGPFNSLDDDGPDTANDPAILFSGTTTAATEVLVFILDGTSPTPNTWVGAQTVVASGATAAQVAAAVETAFEAKGWAGWTGATVATATITFNSTTAAGGGGGGGNPAGIVTGPHNSPHGQQFWVQKDASGKWWYWIDIDSDPDPDVRTALRAFLDNTSVNYDYRVGVHAQAQAMGYSGSGPAT